MSENILLRKLLIDEEGMELHAYKDSVGLWTVGIGHLLDSDQSDEEFAILAEAGYDGSDESIENLIITEDQAFRLFDIDVQEAIHDIYPTFDNDSLNELGEARRAVIISMIFQCGGAGFRKFRKFIDAIKEGDFETASVEMMDSRAAKQAPNRFKRASEAMRTGIFAKYQDIQEPQQPEPNQVETDDGLYEAILERLDKNEDLLKKIYDYITANTKKNWRIK